MAELVDSRKKRLTIPEILVIAAERQNTSDHSTQTAMALLLKEVQLSKRPIVQIGNTLFIEHVGKDKTKNIMFVNPLNADTPINAATNSADLARRRFRAGYDIIISGYSYQGYDAVAKRTAQLLREDGVVTLQQRHGTLTRVIFCSPDYVAREAKNGQ